ncbi:protein kinase subdomain-containing protein PKL CAK Fmp29 [Cyathus striatus]|nr:protein kinase subdomain-containing protein PKL CAK Fmp29 [Cyathus striatus]
MPCLLAASVLLSLSCPRSSLRSLHFPCLSSITRCRWPPRRAFSTKAHPHNELFEYTSGRWIFNEALRLEERKHVFNVDGLRRLAAESVNRSPDDIVDLKKLAEYGSNRTFLITMRDGFKMVARVPYPVTVPKYFTVASEVATMDLLRSSGLPISKVYGYSPTPENAAETEYIFMDFVQGLRLSSIWFDLNEREIDLILRQLVELESKMMSISFPAGGSLYYSKDLEKVASKPGIPLEDKHFSVGPDVNLSLWFSRRSQLDVDRGPYKSAEATLLEAAYKELAYLETFGRPMFPFKRMNRDIYQYQKQLPSEHIGNLNRYLLLAPSLVPKDPSLNHFRIRHPDLHPMNIIIDSNLRVVGLIDWQHTSILPMFALASMPNEIQNYNDPVSKSLAHPSLPVNIDDLDEAQQSQERKLYHSRLLHYHYLRNTAKYNKLHFAAMTSTMGMLRRRLFISARNPWDGEPLSLKVALIHAIEEWEKLTEGGLPCPIMFDAEDVRETMKMVEIQKEGDKLTEMFLMALGIESEGWVSHEDYDKAVARNKEMKEGGLAPTESEEVRAIIASHWPWDDMDETEYL